MPGMFPIQAYDKASAMTEMAWVEDFPCGAPLWWQLDPEVIMPDMGTWELPGTPESRGQLELCLKCPHQLSCLAGVPNKLTTDIVRLIGGGEYW